MHKIPIGIRLDRVLILQLAEKCVSLEDIRDADPISYRSYKLMLEMDPEAVDRDELFLRFYVEEDDRSGLKRIVELAPDGEKIVVNRMRIYVDLLIQHYYVKSIEVHVSRFAKGFNDIIDCSRKRRLFFKSLELEDLDGMLCGNVKPISVDEWKTHTEYNGYLDTDSQIVWFWKIVGDMSAEQKRNLLFFWTSVIYLPVEGFQRLPSRLSIYKTDTTLGHFPSSSTFFYRLYLPPYTSFEAMQDRLHIISQKQNSFRFGKW
ncbi:E3 ubiquitin-protein ligase UPL5 [Heracleum sosnowskyi]|uniref:HECT-type E3 ubiquitin transferase n=1 Tax=Heracleum sosnowskyi TaxID=360622 RepID=A0AAD8MIM3_9APIA|nr:E3 ubiquitin-protein ligase UPL5 [Heracleum sosnowskyi]